MTDQNPFRPSFGVAPHTLVGREEPLERLRVAMAAGPTHPDFTMLIASPRGSGKTVLLKAMRDAAEQAGWATVPITATPSENLSGLITEQLADAVTELDDRRSRRRISSINLSVLGTGGGIELAESAAGADRPRTRMLRTMGALGELAESKHSGALLTLDEFHKAHIDSAREFAHALQAVSKVDAKPVMFVGAGLPSMEDGILADDAMTFFQRIARTPIQPLERAETMRALRAPIVDSGHRVTSEALEAAASAASGYPFMVQLVGYHMWESCTDLDGGVTLADAEAGIRIANLAMVEQVLRPVWRGLSDGDRRVLIEMSRFADAEVRRRDLAAALDKSSGYLATYLTRLEAAGTLYRPSRGSVSFVHEAMRKWLREAHL